jgi:FkbM family methyltransferase
MKLNLQELKRKLFFSDNELLRQTFRDDNVKDIPNVWRLAENMKHKNIKFIRRDPETNRLILKTAEGTYIATDSYFGILNEVFAYGLYEIDEKYFAEPFVVFDLGMNRAYASLFFAQHINCKKVYGYEPDPETFGFAEYNIALNNHLAEKIVAFDFGLGTDDAIVDFYKMPGRDGVNGMNPDSNYVISRKDKQKMQKTTVSVKSASNIINEILKNTNRMERIMLKIDVEGAEYDIFKDLCDNGIIEIFDMILGDIHDEIRPEFEKLKETHNLVHLTQGKIGHGFVFEKKGSWV